MKQNNYKNYITIKIYRFVNLIISLIMTNEQNALLFACRLLCCVPLIVFKNAYINLSSDPKLLLSIIQFKIYSHMVKHNLHLKTIYGIVRTFNV